MGVNAHGQHGAYAEGDELGRKFPDTQKIIKAWILPADAIAEPVVIVFYLHGNFRLLVECGKSVNRINSLARELGYTLNYNVMTLMQNQHIELINCALYQLFTAKTVGGRLRLSINFSDKDVIIN